MNMAPTARLLLRSFFVAALLVPTAVAAQDGENVTIDSGSEMAPDPRDDVRFNALFLEGFTERLAESNVEAEVGKVEFSVQSASELQAFQNRDLRELDESTDQDIILSDDRTNFGHTDIAALMAYRVSTGLLLNVQAKYDIIWRDDSLGRRADAGGTLGFFQLNFDYDFIRTDALRVALKAGRQPFSIGGTPRDYVLEGTLDAAVLTVDARQFGRIRALLFDLYGGNSLPVVGYQFYRDGSEPVFGLRGETNTWRHGAVYELDAAATGIPLTAKAYYFFTSVGGGPIEETGADLTFGGTFGNFRDRDYTHLYGARASYSVGIDEDSSVRFYGDFSQSQGIDRKPDFFYDVDLAGSFFGGGALASVGSTSGVNSLFGVEFYRADGATFASDGVEFERGYVGGRGARIGGLAIGRQAAWRPSAVMDAFGIDHTPNDISRSAGTQFLHATFGLEFLARYQVLLDYWNYTDTADASLIDFANLDAIPEPGFGLSREEIAARERFGRSLGQEINVEGRVTLQDHLALYATYGLFLPGSFYDIEVSQVAGRRETSLGGGATFWTARVGGEVRF